MAIVQISRIIQRSGDLVDLPQLAEAEFGWATDAKRLFIGKTEPNENIEVLTSYSDISFGQIEGSYGNLNLNTPVTGQILTYNSSSNVWVNTGGNALNPSNTSQYSNNQVHLGNVGNVKLGGGSIGYVLETDGRGNLSWSSKGTLRNNILALSNSTPVIMTIDPNTPYTRGLLITITGANATNANTIINGKSFYIGLSVDFPTSGNVALYADSGLITPLNGSTLGAYQSNSGVSTALLGGTGAGIGTPAGAVTSIQFNSGAGTFGGSAGLTWDTGSSLMTVTGNVNISGTTTTGALTSNGSITGSQLYSTVVSPTPPLVVTSSARIANANVQTAGNLINGTSNVIVTTSGNVSIGVSGVANLAVVSSDGLGVSRNANITGNLRTGGNITAVGNANVGNLVVNGTVSSTTLSTTGNANVGNIGANNAIFITIQGNGAGLTNLAASNVSGQVANSLLAGTVYTNAQPNITSVGTLTSLTISGNANIGNIGASSAVFTVVNATTIGNIGANIIGNGIGLTSIPAANLNGQVNLTSQVTGALPITSGGTGQSTVAAAINALLPNQSGNAGKGLVTNGTDISWTNTATETWVKNLINTIEPIGTIKAWAGSINNIPTGWALCNGANGTLNLSDRFITGYGSSKPQNTTGGNDPNQLNTPINGFAEYNGYHSHSGATVGHTLTEAQMPSHFHTSTVPGGGFVVNVPTPYGYGLGSNPNGLPVYLNGATQTVGGNQGHSHGIFTDGLHFHSVTGTASLPGYSAIAFIQKIANLV